MKAKRIIVIRHAESEEDISPNLNGERIDKEISITRNGKIQARNTVRRVLERVCSYDSVRIYSSPSNRAVETAQIIESGLRWVKADLLIEPRIRNLNWGNTAPENIRHVEKERYEAGVLYYKFSGGDNSATFVGLIGCFISEILNHDNESPEALVIVTHGFALRIIAKFLLQMSDEDFRWIKNPANCYIADFTVLESGENVIETPLEKREPT